MELAEKLTLLRRKEGMSQEQLADRLRVTRQSVSKWESGASVPELAKLVAIADLFEVSLDYLVRNRQDAEGADGAAGRSEPRERTDRRTEADVERLEKKIAQMEREFRGYEYVSEKKLGGIPLVCIRIWPTGRPVRAAKGILAIGNVAVGVVAVGGISCGIVGFGMIGIGLLALGGVAMGALALGGTAVGLLAFGGAAAGVVAVGASSFGIYSCGAAAVGREVAVGSHVAGRTVVGKECSGEHILQYYQGMPREAVRAFLLEHCPGMPRLLLELFSTFGENIG